jgi:hypothetical protein
MNPQRRCVGGEKVRTASLLQGSGLVRTVGKCVPRRVASGYIETKRTVQSATHSKGPQVLLNAELEQAAKPRAKREPRSVLCHACQYSSPVDSTFEQSENVTIAHFLVKSSSS